MSTRLTTTIALMIFAGASAQAATFTGPTSSYYLSDGTTMWQVKGLAILNSWAVTGMPAAIDATIRTDGNNPGTTGAEYSLAGTPTGTTYTNTTGEQIWDGTTDTRHNYTVTSGNGSALVQTDLDWSNPVVLFNLGTAGYDSLGVTYDASNNSVWISQWNGGTTVSNYTLSGTLLSSFSTGFTDIGGLALDPADNTLWLTHFADSNLYQYDKAGNLLQSGTIAGLGTTMWSGEMVESAAAVVATGAPEPGSMLLFGAGAALLWIRRRH